MPWISRAPLGVATLNSRLRRPQYVRDTSMLVASKSRGSLYSPALVVNAASVASVLRLMEFGNWPGRTLMTIGTTQSMRNDAERRLFARSGSTSSAFFSASSAVRSTVLAPGDVHSSRAVKVTLRGLPTASAFCAEVQLAGVTVTPAPPVAVAVSTASIGVDGPRLSVVTSSEAVAG